MRLAARKLIAIIADYERRKFGMQSTASRMKRLWGFIHVRPLTVFLGFAEILFIVIQALIAGSYLASSTHRTAAMIHMTVVILTAIAVFLLLAGIFYKIPLLLGPHIVMQVTVTFILLLLTIGSIACLISGTSIQMRMVVAHSNYALTSETISSASHFNASVVSNFLAGILLVVAIWCIGVVLDCYRFLSIHQQDKGELPSIVPPIVVDPKPIPLVPATDF